MFDPDATLFIQPGAIIFGLIVVTAGVLLTMRRLLWMNEALATDLFMSECEIRADKRVPLVGTPDEVYKGLRGEFIPVDTRIRPHAPVYESVRAQLLVYRTILRHSPSRALGLPRLRRVSSYGFICFETPDGTRWKRVKLYTDARAKRLYNRRVRLEHSWLGRPKYNGYPKLCPTCDYRNICPKVKKHGLSQPRRAPSL